MIIAFPQKSRVVITSARITKTSRKTASGTLTIYHNPPELRFFLDFEDSDGSCGVWDGPSYAGALDAARDWLADGVEVRDRAFECRGRA